MTNKKDTERKIIEAVRELLPDFPQGEIAHSESPDFLIKTSPEKVIGIDVTEYHHGYGDENGDKTKQADNSWGKAFNQTRQELEKHLSNNNLLVFVRRAGISRPLPQNAIPDMAARLANLIIQHHPQDAGGKVILDLSKLREYGFGNELAQITINHVPGVATRLVPLDSFGVPNAIDHPGIVCNTLQAIIDSKETKLPQYRQKCDEAWLVIYTGHSPSSRIDMAFGLGDCQFATQFDKVLLYDQDQEINQVFTLA